MPSLQMRIRLLMLLVSGACAANRLEAKWSWGGEHREHFSAWQSIGKTMNDVKETVNRPVRYEVYKDGNKEAEGAAISIKDAIDDVKKFEEDGDGVTVSWMWGDASILSKDNPLSGFAQKLAAVDPFRWSKKKSPQDICKELQEEDEKQDEKAKRPVKIQITSLDLNQVISNVDYDSSLKAVEALEELLLADMDAKQLEEFRNQELKIDLEKGCEAKWMWGDIEGAFGPEAEKKNPFRWSKYKTPGATAEDLDRAKDVVVNGKPNSERPVNLKIKSAYTGKVFVDTEFRNIDGALFVLGKWMTQDKDEREQIEEQLRAQGYVVKWMWGDADAKLNEVARLDNFRWSHWGRPHEVIEAIKTTKRPVRYQVENGGGDAEVSSLGVAIEEIQTSKPENNVKWMWADASILGEKNKIGKQLAKIDPTNQRWSKFMTASDIIEDMKSEAEKEMQRAVNVKVKQYADDWIVADLRLPNRDAAIEEIKKYPEPSEEPQASPEKAGASHGEEL